MSFVFSSRFTCEKQVENMVMEFEMLFVLLTRQRLYFQRAAKNMWCRKKRTKQSRSFCSFLGVINRPRTAKQEFQFRQKESLFLHLDL